MPQNTTSATPAHSSTATDQPSEPAVQKQQAVSFSFYKLDPAFRRLSVADKQKARQEFVQLCQQPPQGMMCLPYSTVGLKSDVDFLLWRISYNLDDFQQHQQAINRSMLGGYLTIPTCYLSMTKRSTYVDKIDEQNRAAHRFNLVPGERKYLFVYPFVKTRQWYLLPKDQRQSVMNEHIGVGIKYKRVKLNTTYSFGLDNQDFVVAFETEEPADFLDLVMELRETQSSLYTQRDTPMYTCTKMTIEQIMDQLF